MKCITKVSSILSAKVNYINKLDLKQINSVREQHEFYMEGMKENKLRINESHLNTLVSTDEGSRPTENI